MADEPQPPAPAPQQDHQTMVLTDPPQDKHHVLLWGLCITTVAIVTGSLVAYWYMPAPMEEVAIEVGEEEGAATATSQAYEVIELSIEDNEKIIALLNSEYPHIDYVVSLRHQWENFYVLSVGERNVGASAVLFVHKKSDGTFEKILTSQEEFPCETVEQYQVPHQIMEVCSYYEGGELRWRPNPL